MKKLAIAIIVLLVFCGAALWYFGAAGLNQFVKEQIEVQGTKVTGNQVSVGKVDIMLTQGAFSIGGLKLANGEGFNNPNLFTLGDITLDIDTKLEEPYTIEQFLIQNPEFFVEVTETGDSNIQQLYKNIEKNVPKSSAPQAEKSPTEQTADPLVKVEKLLVKDVTLNLDLTRLGNKVHKKTLPTIDLGNIGGEAGIPASQMGVEVVKKLSKAIVDHVKKEQQEELKNKIKDKAKKELGKLFG